MKPIPILPCSAVLLAAALFNSCESTGEGGSYSESGYYPDYYGSYVDGEYTGRGKPDPRPSHPIATPPPAIARPMPMPMARPAFRR